MSYPHLAVLSLKTCAFLKEQKAMKMGDFDGEWTWEKRLLWTQACETANACKNDFIWFTNRHDQGVQDDYETCAQAAKQGDKRAQRYIAIFMALRMKS